MEFSDERWSCDCQTGMCDIFNFAALNSLIIALYRSIALTFHSIKWSLLIVDVNSLGDISRQTLKPKLKSPNVWIHFDVIWLISPDVHFLFCFHQWNEFSYFCRWKQFLHRPTTRCRNAGIFLHAAVLFFIYLKIKQRAELATNMSTASSINVNVHN